ncbi:hypothetical protein GON03_21065 [Nocardioides sp. MAH-18]|uniref:FlgD Ig-like domain-containing protein n=1 Tax=Nocardioides agri TaxID=2682843 RepID=A0A6L6XX71_9ACTN|nr:MULTISPECIES: hypothetical protein [unclassified Nocardioides]MBA2952515.1 hypothetical protein [Nocardioides sp. CGMCC 1.13656]MVQ51678.1 hypothetical protein [Nocardioides sp. MAH-18]
MRSSIKVVLVRAALVSGLVVSGLAVAPAGTAAPVRPVISIGHFRPTVSPDGDGYHDSLRVPIDLARRAFVTIRVRDVERGRTVRNGPLGGTQWDAPGRRVLTLGSLFTGVARPLPAGRYRLSVIARPYGDEQHPRTARATFTLHSGPVSLDVRTSTSAAAEGLRFAPGSGVRSRARIGYVLERRSRVTAVVAGHRIPLGAQPAGHHAWWWNGRIGGRAAAEGEHRVTLRARPVAPRSRAGAVTVRTVVDLTAPDPTLNVNRSTVYPAATVIEDSLRVGLDLPPGEVTSAQVRAVDEGRLTARLAPVEHECSWGDRGSPYYVACTLLTWDARTPSGPVAPGDYLLRLVVTDDVGNSRVVRRPVSVSAGQLVEQTGSVTWTGLSAPPATDPCFANGCGDYAPCASHPSERFAGGVSFRSDQAACPGTEFQSAVRDYGFTPPLTFGTTPFDRFRVVAVGGPTTPGDDDTAWVTARGGVSDSDGATLAADGSAATPWMLVRPDVELFSTSPRTRWSAGTSRPNRYDVATYTLEYTYYVPAG